MSQNEKKIEVLGGMDNPKPFTAWASQFARPLVEECLANLAAGGPGMAICPDADPEYIVAICERRWSLSGGPEALFRDTDADYMIVVDHKSSEVGRHLLELAAQLGVGSWICLDDMEPLPAEARVQTPAHWQ